MAPDAFLVQTLEKIDRYGWSVVAVGGGPCSCPGCDGGDDEASFAYTVGMTTLGHPEVITYGLPPQTAMRSLNLIGARVKAGRPPRMGRRITGIFPGYRGFLLAEANRDDLVVAQQVYPEIEAVQLVWPDRAGRFPWEPGYAIAPFTQPLIGPMPKV